MSLLPQPSPPMETISWAIFLETNYENGERERDKKKKKKDARKKGREKEKTYANRATKKHSCMRSKYLHI